MFFVLFLGRCWTFTSWFLSSLLVLCLVFCLFPGFNVSLSFTNTIFQPLNYLVRFLFAESYAAVSQHFSAFTALPCSHLADGYFQSSLLRYFLQHFQMMHDPIFQTGYSRAGWSPSIMSVVFFVLKIVSFHIMRCTVLHCTAYLYLLAYNLCRQ